jgi:hypothetical protein
MAEITYGLHQAARARKGWQFGCPGYKLAPESKENEELKQRRWERKRGKKGNEKNHYFLD